VIRAEDLSKEIAGETIVDSISIAVDRGEVLCIVGPSGAGKSSFLRLLNRLDEPTGGTVYVDGTDYRDLRPQELRLRVGLVSQDPGLIDGTVFENVVRGPVLRGEPYDEAEVSRLLAEVGLTGYESRDVADVSGGEAQRVAIARTLLSAPEVLLLDEPTASLDSKTETRIESLLEARVSERELTCVLVTHDPEQAKRLADRVVSMRSGSVETIGPPETTFR
jgi:putative ABC transport system ATP-binding protein